MNTPLLTLEHVEAMQRDVDIARAKRNEALTDEERAQYQLIDKFIKDASEMKLSIYIDARLPVHDPKTETTIMQNIQFNNDMKVIFEEDDNGFPTKETRIKLYNVHNIRILNFMKFSVFATCGKYADIDTTLRVFLQRLASIHKHLKGDV